MDDRFYLEPMAGDHSGYRGGIGLQGRVPQVLIRGLRHGEVAYARKEE